MFAIHTHAHRDKHKLYVHMYAGTHTHIIHKHFSDMSEQLILVAAATALHRHRLSTSGSAFRRR